MENERADCSTIREWWVESWLIKYEWWRRRPLRYDERNSWNIVQTIKWRIFSVFFFFFFPSFLYSFLLVNSSVRTIFSCTNIKACIKLSYYRVSKITWYIFISFFFIFFFFISLKHDLWSKSCLKTGEIRLERKERIIVSFYNLSLSLSLYIRMFRLHMSSLHLSFLPLCMQ